MSPANVAGKSFPAPANGTSATNAGIAFVLQQRRLQVQPMRLRVFERTIMPIELHFKNRMEPHNNTDEERKRKAFMNALSNLGLLEMSEEDKAETDPVLPNLQFGRREYQHLKCGNE